MRELQTRKLSNGVTILCETTEDDMSYIGIGFKVGSRDELSPEKYGIAHCVEHMMFKSTKNRTGKEASKELDNLGVISNAYTDIDKTVYHSECHIKDFNKVVDIMFDQILNHLFDENELELEKDIIHQEFVSNLSDPYYIFSSKVCESIFNSPYGHQILGDINSIKKFKKEDLEDFYQRNYTSNRCVISFVGKLTINQLVKILSPYCYKLNFGTEYNHPVTGYTYNINKKLHISGLKQNNVTIFGAPISLKERNYNKIKAVMYCLNFTLSNGMSSRLCKRIREELGLVYNIYASFYSVGDLETPLIGFTSDKDPYMVIREIDKVLKEIINGDITTEELLKSKRQLEISLMIKNKELNNIYLIRLEDYLCGEILTDKESKELLKKIETVTQKDIVNLAKRLYGKYGLIIGSSTNSLCKKFQDYLNSVFKSKRG